MTDQIAKWLADNATALQAITHVIWIIGIPVFIIVFFRNARRDDIARQEKIYDDVDESFVSFNRLIINYPHLNVTWFDVPSKVLSDNERTQQYVLFDLLTSMFERAYLTYLDASSNQRRHQWQGWQDYIDQYCRKKDYQAWWFDERHKVGEEISLTYDRAFELFVLERLRIARERGDQDNLIAAPLAAE